MLRDMSENTGKTIRNFIRMREDDFEYLLSMLTEQISKQNTNMRLAVTPRERLLITLRYLATGDSYISLEYMFRLPKKAEEWKEISDGFERKFGFPHAI
uniref:Uncharacterized protein n=1 Tax=Anopheles quadriannulatus TaxID=34691 RepID=A0A182WUS4_ANOQN